MALDKDKLMASALKLIQQNRLDKAIKELRRILEEDPKDIRVLQKLGDVCAKSGDRAEATKAYGQVAQFYTEQGFYLKAVAIYKTVLRVDPNLMEANLKLAELYHQLGLMNDCVAQYQAVANQLDRLGRTKESLGILKKMVDLDTENVASRIKLAELYSGQQMVAEAIAEFETAAEQLRLQERGDDYVKVAERLLYHDPSRVAVARTLASMYLQRGDPKRALSKLQVCFKADSRDVETLTLLSQAFRDIDQVPKSVSVLRELARVYAEDGKPQEADGVWRRVLELNPQDDEAQRALGMLPSEQQHEGIRHEPSFVGAFPAAPQSQVASHPISSAAIPVWPQAASAVPPRAAAPPPAAAPAHLQPKAATGLGAIQGKPNTPQEHVTKLLAETDVYVKYGLREKALAHVRKVFEIEPEHLEAHEKLRGLLIKAGDISGAADEVITCFRIAMGRGDRNRARMYLADLSSIQSTHPAIATMREELDGVPAAAPLAINVLRRQGVAPPAPAAVVSAPSEELLVVDADDPMEAGSGVLNIAPDLDAAMAGPMDPGEDLLAEGAGLGDMHLGSPDEASVSPLGDDFSDFLGDAAGAANMTADPLLEAAPLDDELMVPASDALISLDPSGSDPFLDAPSLDDNLLADAALAAAALPDDGAGYSDLDAAPLLDEDDDPNSRTQAVDSRALHQAMEEAASADEAARQVLDDAFAASPAQQPVDGVAGSWAPAPDGVVDSTMEEALPPGLSQPAAGAAPLRPARKAAAAPAPPPPQPAAAPPAPVSDEPDMAEEFFPDELAEADFFVQNGLFDEAREILQKVLDDVPDSRRANHMLAVANALELGEEPPVMGAAAPARPPEDDNAFDLARELDSELGDLGDDLGGIPVEPTEQVSVDTVLAEFKKGVDKVVAQDDADTHHDLGIAYKEMGLLEDAVGEFQRSSRSPRKEADALYMIGVCRMEQGQHKEAGEAFLKAAQSPNATDYQKTAAGYERGVCLQSMGDMAAALDAMRAVAALDATFKDVKQKIAQLEPLASAGVRKAGNGTAGRPAADGSKKGKNIGYI